jgi:HEAT repeat protein
VLERALMTAHEQGREALEPLRVGIAALQQQAQRQQAVAIDYRPLFDDLRSQLQRQALAIAELRAAGGAVAQPTPAPAQPTPAGEPSAAPGLAPALQTQIAKLASAEAALRFEAVDELARSKDPAVLPSLLPMVRDADAFVRRLTVEVLRDFRHVEAVDALLVALGDDDENVRDTAWRSLRELTGQKLAFDATASKDARGKAAAKWQEWWGTARATFGS